MPVLSRIPARVVTGSISPMVAAVLRDDQVHEHAREAYGHGRRAVERLPGERGLRGVVGAVAGDERVRREVAAMMAEARRAASGRRRSGRPGRRLSRLLLAALAFGAVGVAIGRLRARDTAPAA